MATKQTRPRRTPTPAKTQARTRLAQRRFLAALAKVGTVAGGCKAARIARATHYEWLKTDAAYRRAFDEALETVVDVAEEELVRRAVRGVLKPVYQQGHKVGTIREYSDTCLTFYLKGRRAEIYNRERHEHSGPGGGPIPVELLDAARSSLAKKLEQLQARLSGAPRP